MVDGDGAGEDRRPVEGQIAHLRADVVQIGRRFKAEFVQHELRLVGNKANAGGAVIPLTQSVAQRRIGDGRDDGIGIRILVTCDINRFSHGELL